MDITVYVVVEVHNNGEFEGIYGVYATLEDAEEACAVAEKTYEYPSVLSIYTVGVE
jgi:hypothetical protein